MKQHSPSGEVPKLLGFQSHFEIQRSSFGKALGSMQDADAKGYEVLCSFSVYLLLFSDAYRETMRAAILKI